MLSFNPSTPVKIFSKDLNDGGEIWGVEVRNQITNNISYNHINFTARTFTVIMLLQLFFNRLKANEALSIDDIFKKLEYLNHSLVIGLVRVTEVTVTAMNR